jgi:hypothetical protein
VTAGTNGDSEIIGARELDAADYVSGRDAPDNHCGMSRVNHPVPGSTGSLIALLTGEHDFAEHTRFEFSQRRRFDRSTDGRNDFWLRHYASLDRNGSCGSS